MVDKFIRQTSKKSWYRLSIYINVILFFIIAVFIFFLIRDFYNAMPTQARNDSELWLNILRDIAFIAVALSLIFFQFFRNLYTLIKRSL